MHIAQEKLNVLLSTEDMDVIRTYILNTSNKIRACYYSKIHWSTFDKAMLGGPVKLYQRHKLLEYCRMVKEKGEEGMQVGSWQ
jgi:hypothetical protein